MAARCVDALKLKLKLKLKFASKLCDGAGGASLVPAVEEGHAEAGRAGGAPAVHVAVVAHRDVLSVNARVSE
jgi:hypothetical protein